jgi:uncharacterized membrane protein
VQVSQLSLRLNLMAEIAGMIGALWPVGLGFITLVIVLAKMEVRIGVAEEKIKALFDLWNSKDK